MSAFNLIRTRLWAAALTALLLAASSARGDAYDDLTTYDWTGSRAPLAAIENETRDAATPQARQAIEAKLLKVLAAPNATRGGKQFACRMLRRCGSTASVPTLAKLLGNAEMSHMARFALQHLPGPEATAALLDALGKLDGKLKIGMVTSLGERGDPKAVPALAKLVASTDAQMARAAVHALGRVATPEAADALADAKVADPLRTEWADASMRCADHLLADGKPAPAASVYRTMLADANPKMIRIAALRGVAMADKGRAIPNLLTLMRGDDADLAKAATRFAIEVPGNDATKALAAALVSMPPKGQTMVIDALTARADSAAAPQVLALVKGQDEGVRIAAIRALATLGDAACVEPLARLAASGGATGQAAADSLTRLKGEGVADAMGKLLDSPDAPVRAGVLGVLANRADRSMAPVMLKAARDKDEAVRKAAIKGLTGAAGEKELPELVALLLAAETTSEQSALERAVAATARRVDGADARTAPIVAALPRAKAKIQSRLIAVLSRLGGQKALEAVRAQLDAKDPDVATAAVRALHDWPDDAPAPDLLSIIKTAKVPAHKVLAFRGYIRMANMAAERPSAETNAMYKQALALATTPAEKKSVLAGLANARSVEALKLVQPLIADPALRAEAEMATVQIASNARDTGPTEARAALKNIVASTKNDAIRKKAQGTINEMDKNLGYIRTWLGSGPYTKGSPFATAYPPEQKDAKDVKWKVLTRGVGPQIIDLEQAIGSGDKRAAYMKTHVWSSEDQDVQLQLGSDDGVKVWVNGKLVHANNANRPCRPANDKAKASLAKGWNTVMVKVSDNTADWAFCLRIVKPDGSVLEGLRVSLEEEK